MRISSVLSALAVATAWGSIVLGAAGCSSGEAAPARTPADEIELAPSEEEPHSVSLIPSCKAGSDGECLPPSPWVDKLCSGVHPEVALHMFRGGSPWKRLYSRARAPAYNGAGGPSLSDERVEKAKS